MPGRKSDVGLIPGTRIPKRPVPEGNKLWQGALEMGPPRRIKVHEVGTLKKLGLAAKFIPQVGVAAAGAKAVKAGAGAVGRAINKIPTPAPGVPRREFKRLIRNEPGKTARGLSAFGQRAVGAARGALTPARPGPGGPSPRVSVSERALRASEAMRAGKPYGGVRKIRQTAEEIARAARAKKPR